MNFKLIRGEGSPKNGACWMSMLNALVQPDFKATWTDQPECVSPVVRNLCIFLNDFLRDDERERVIGPHLFAPVGTAIGDSDEQRRGWLCMDYAVRRVAPLYAGKCADALRELEPVRDPLTAMAALKVLAADPARLRSVIVFQHAVFSSVAPRINSLSCANHFSLCAHRATRHRDAEIRAARREQVIQAMLDLILECCAIGQRQEIPRVRTVEELVALVGT